MSDLPPQLKPANPVQDPVHGRIWLTRVEVDLINTPELQRLRRIGQLHPADLVFPGATHNRFAHSLGAMHVMGWILRQRKLQEYFKKHGLTSYIPVLRIAALLHDIGHLPFSHVGETAWGIAQTARFENLENEGVSVFDLASSGSRRAYHEELSVKLIHGDRIRKIINRHIRRRFDGRTAAETVARIVDGTEPNVVMRNLLSSELDCDRLDYLVRDSVTSGLVYGRVDLAYLIGSLVVCTGGGDDVLAIDERHGLRAAEHYLFARYYHYAQFISHKTITSAEVTLTAAILELIRAGALKRPAEIDEIVADPARVNEFLALTDGTVESKLLTAANDHPNRPDLVEAATRLIERKLMKTVARDDRLEDKPRQRQPAEHRWDTLLARTKKHDFAARCDVEPGYFCYRSSRHDLSGAQASVPPSEIFNPTQRNQWQKAAKVGEHGGEARLVVEKSNVLGHLSGQVWATRRVFAREPLSSYGSRTRTEQFERLRSCVEEEKTPSR